MMRGKRKVFMDPSFYLTSLSRCWRRTLTFGGKVNFGLSLYTTNLLFQSGGGMKLVLPASTWSPTHSFSTYSEETGKTS